MTKTTQPNFYINDNISLQPKEAFSLYYTVKILAKLTEQYPVFRLLSTEFFSKFLSEIYPDVFSGLSHKTSENALIFIVQGKESQLFDYIKQVCPFVFVSPELFFDNIAVIRQRVLDCWLLPLERNGEFQCFLDSTTENGLIADYKYKYLLDPLNFGNFSTNIE